MAVIADNTTRARRLLEARLKRKWSLSEAAKKTGINKSTIWRLEKGIIPQVVDVMLAMEYGISPSFYLLQKPPASEDIHEWLNEQEHEWVQEIFKITKELSLAHRMNNPEGPHPLETMLHGLRLAHKAVFPPKSKKGQALLEAAHRHDQYSSGQASLPTNPT